MRNETERKKQNEIEKREKRVWKKDGEEKEKKSKRIEKHKIRKKILPTD